MNLEFNWRRLLAFTPVMVVLAALTVYGPDVMPRYLIGALVVFLFMTLFIIFYSLPRWKPTLPRERATTARILSVFATVAIAFIGIVWFNRRFPQRAPWLDSLVILASVFVGVLLLRGRARK